jgi:hypothetical protein
MLTTPITANSPALMIAPCDPSQALSTQPAISLWRLKNQGQPVVVVAKKQVAAIYHAMPEITEVVIAPQNIFGSDGVINFLTRLKKQRFKNSYLLCNRLGAQALTALLDIDRRYPFKKISTSPGLTSHRSADYAALLLNLTSVSEVPIRLPVPALRADGQSQRAFLRECGIESEQYGKAGTLSKLRPARPIFVIELTTHRQEPALINETLGLCFRRWPSAYVAILKDNSATLHCRSEEPEHQACKTIALPIASKLALVSMAAAIITDSHQLVQFSDAFGSPVVRINHAATDSVEQKVPLLPSHQGRFSLSSTKSEEILQNIEKVLRFDGQHQGLSKTA